MSHRGRPGLALVHDGTLFFEATNGGNVTTHENTEADYYLPLEQLFKDLDNNQVGKYNLITPDQYNDMHSPLANSVGSESPRRCRDPCV
jgi:hypothetical protein